MKANAQPNLNYVVDKTLVDSQWSVQKFYNVAQLYWEFALLNNMLNYRIWFLYIHLLSNWFCTNSIKTLCTAPSVESQFIWYPVFADLDNLIDKLRCNKRNITIPFKQTRKQALSCTSFLYIRHYLAFVNHGICQSCVIWFDNVVADIITRLQSLILKWNRASQFHNYAQLYYMFFKTFTCEISYILH